MKAKELAEQLMQTPDLEIVILDTSLPEAKATGLQLGRVVDSLFCTCEYVDRLQKHVDDFAKIDLEERFLKENACQYTTLDTYIESAKISHTRRVAFLEKVAAAPFVLSLI